MSVVAVTGTASDLGRRVLLRLRAGGHEVVAVDSTRPDAPVAFRQANPDRTVRGGTLHGADVVVHLLHSVQPSHDPSRDAALDVEATRSVLRAAEAARVGALVHVSSATVYGAEDDNPVPLTEDAPLRAGPEFAYAWHKRLAEELVADWAEDHPEARVVVLRPTTVLGSAADDFVARHLQSLRLPLVRGHAPPMQALHPDDLVAAVRLAVEGELRGAYNVAPDGWLTADEVCAILGRKPLRLPESLAFPLAGRLWASHLTVAPAGGLHYLMYPWVVDTRRLREAGWAPRHTNREVLRAFGEANRGRVAFGPLRTTRRTLAAGGVGVAALGGIVLRRLRRA